MAVRPGRDIKGPFITGGNPDTANDAPVTATTVGAAYDLSGQLGAIYRSNDGQKEWIYVKFSSTSTGKAPAVNQVLFWVQNSTANLAAPNAWVVDNQTTANSGTSVFDVAGILRVAATRGNYVWALRKSGSVAVPIVSTTTAAPTIAGTQVFASTASGEAVVGTTSTTVPATGPNATPWFMSFGAKLGWLASSSTGFAFVGSTSTSGLSVNLPTFLDIE